jgi:hypothetical protein
MHTFFLTASFVGTFLVSVAVKPRGKVYLTQEVRFGEARAGQARVYEEFICKSN